MSAYTLGLIMWADSDGVADAQWVISEDGAKMQHIHPLCTPVAFDKLCDILEPTLRVGSEIAIQMGFCFVTYKIRAWHYDITALPARLAIHRLLRNPDAASLASFRSRMTDLLESIDDEECEYRRSHPIQPCSSHFCTVINVFISYPIDPV